MRTTLTYLSSVATSGSLPTPDLRRSNLTSSSTSDEPSPFGAELLRLLIFFFGGSVVVAFEMELDEPMGSLRNRNGERDLGKEEKKGERVWRWREEKERSEIVDMAED